MRNVFEYYSEDNYLAHHGILGQKWGIRRFQNKDGSLTNAGKQRYSSDDSNAENTLSDRSKQIEQAVHNSRMKNDSYYQLDKRQDMTKEQKDAVYKKQMNNALTKMLNNAKTDEEKTRKVTSLNTALKEDRWNLDFLEAIQNSGIMHDGNTRAMLIEYANFLDDPDDYWQNGRNKLYGV